MRRKGYGKFRFTVKKKILPSASGFLIPYVTVFYFIYGDDVTGLFNPLDLFNYIFVGVGVIFFKKIFSKRLVIDMYDEGMVFKMRDEIGAIYYKEIDRMSFEVEESQSITLEHYSELYLVFENNKHAWSKKVNLDDLPMGKERIKFLAFVLESNPDIRCDENVVKMLKKGSLNSEKGALAIMIALSIAATVLPLHAILK